MNRYEIALGKEMPTDTPRVDKLIINGVDVSTYGFLADKKTKILAYETTIDHIHQMIEDQGYLKQVAIDQVKEGILNKLRDLIQVTECEIVQNFQTAIRAEIEIVDRDNL